MEPGILVSVYDSYFFYRTGKLLLPCIFFSLCGIMKEISRNGGFAMSITKYFYYTCCDKFKEKKPAKKNDLVLPWHELVGYSTTLGLYNGYSGSGIFRLHYSTLSHLLLDEKAGNYVISDTYKKAEASFKGSYSFFLGMLAAKIIAHRNYNIRHLFHLNDSCVVFVPHKGPRPDFFGLDNSNAAFLFESKGTAKPNCSSETIDDAKAQLKAIRQVRYAGKKYFYSKLHKHIITSSFPKEIWTIDDIDPSDSGDVTLFLDFDKAMFLYYRTIMELLLHAPSRSERTFSGTPFVCARVTDELCVGLHKGCYDFFQKGYGQYFTSQTSSSQIDVDPERFCPGVYDEVTSILSSFTPPEVTETLSILPDGILCASTL